MTTSHTTIFSGETDIPAPPQLLCTSCGTSHALIIEAIGTISPAVPGHISIKYTCSACGSVYGHAATVQQAANLLIAGPTTPGALRFGRHFIHCGEPMAETGEANLVPFRPEGSRRGRPAAISMRTRLLTCHCGFQQDVPL